MFTFTPQTGHWGSFWIVGSTVTFSLLLALGLGDDAAVPAPYAQTKAYHGGEHEGQLTQISQVKSGSSTQCGATNVVMTPAVGHVIVTDAPSEEQPTASSFCARASSAEQIASSPEQTRIIGLPVYCPGPQLGPAQPTSKVTPGLHWVTAPLVQPHSRFAPQVDWSQGLEASGVVG